MRTALRSLAAIIAVGMGLAAYILYPPAPRPVVFPNGKTFAFSIVDDTDMTTLERSKPLYDVLHRYGLRTTKTVWALASNDRSHPPNAGDTLQDADYSDFIVELQSRGFEIALHGVRGGSSTRGEIREGLEQFSARLGHYPKMHVNHSLNRDNVYWGSNRWSFAPFRWAYSRVRDREFEGDRPESPFFWGDILRERIVYVNQFTYGDINLLGLNPSIPYQLSDKPYVNYWFPTSDGDNLDRFERLLSTENLDRLEREGGVCLVYTHMGAGSFNRGGAANPRFVARIRDIAARDGWFAPASEILDFLRRQPGWKGDLTFREKVRLETLFLWNSVRRSILAINQFVLRTSSAGQR
jgi:hypothetical protein